MKYDPNQHNRRSIRLKGYDYAQPGAYFITICTWHRQNLFGEIATNEMYLSNYGKIIQLYWENLPKYHRHLELDQFVIMPNHMHGILILTDNTTYQKRHRLPEIIRAFKTFSARRVNKIRRLSGVSVWQRGYYEHIIRQEKSLKAIQEYIINNPLSWEKDELHPVHPHEWDGHIKDLGLQLHRRER